MPTADIVTSEYQKAHFTTGPEGVDGAVGVAEPHWYIAIVNSRHEKAVARKLREIGVKSYVASQWEARVWANGRRKKIERVIISSIVFVHCTESSRREIVNLPYINRFMTDRAADGGSTLRRLATVPEVQMQKLMFMLGQADSPVGFDPCTLKVDDNVRVIRGPLRTLEGIITQNSDGTHTLTVSIPLLGGANVRINPLDVEPL